MDKSTLNSFTSDSSIHGIRFIFDNSNHKSVKIFWAISFILSILGFSYYAHGVYLKYKVNPDIAAKVQFKPIREVPFPAITICLPLFTKNNMAHFTNYMRMSQLYASEKQILTTQEQRYLSANTQACNPHLSSIILNGTPNATDIDIVKLLEESSPAVSEAFGICFYRKRAIDCEKIFTRVLTNNGLCYTYNMQDFNTLFNQDTISKDFHSYKKKFPTNDSQWSIHDGYKSAYDDDLFPVRALYSNVATFYPRINKTDITNLCKRASKGFRLYIHASHEILTHFHNEYFVPFKREKQITLSARMTHYDRDLIIYSAVKRGCYFENERKLKFFKSYSKAHCLLECLTNFILSKCGCVKFSMPHASDTPVCNLSMAWCYLDANSRWPRDDFQKSETALPCDCFATCDDIVYKIMLEKTGEFESKIVTLPIDDYFSEISIRFIDLLVEVDYYYVGYKLQNLIADMGGLLGLFIGSSILSIVEIFYYLLKGFYNRYQRVQMKVKKIAFIKRTVAISTFPHNVVKEIEVSERDFLDTLQHVDGDIYIVKCPLYNRNQ